MSNIPRARYTPEFRAEAVKLVLEKNMTPPEAAASLGVPEQTFGNWLRAIKKVQASPVSDTSGRMVTPQDAEIARLRRELAEAKMERDVLKKAAAYFAKESWTSTRS